MKRVILLLILHLPQPSEQTQRVYTAKGIPTVQGDATVATDQGVVSQQRLTPWPLNHAWRQLDRRSPT